MDDDVRGAEAYQTAIEKLKTEVESLQKEMQNSVPFYSCRYKVSKMIYYPLLPSLLLFKLN